MANENTYDEILRLIETKIRINNNGEIEGDILQNVLVTMLDYSRDLESSIKAYHPEPSDASYMISLYKYPVSGGEVEGGGEYTAGSIATITATPANGYKFDRWSDSATEGTPRQITVTENAAFTACFMPNAQPGKTYTITALSDPSVGGTVTGGGTYVENSQITLKATPNYGYEFDKWSDESVSQELSVIVTEDKTFTAFFNEKQKYTVDVSVDPIGSGSVSGAGTYVENEKVRLTASASDGYIFDRWSDGSTASTITFNITHDTSYTAYFTEAPVVEHVKIYDYDSSSKLTTTVLSKVGNFTMHEMADDASTYVSNRITKNCYFIAIPKNINVTNVYGTSNDIGTEWGLDAFDNCGDVSIGDASVQYTVYAARMSSPLNVIFDFSFTRI